MVPVLALLLLTSALAAASGPSSSIIDLSQGNWTLVNANRSIALDGVVVPGSVTEALMQHGIIGDPLFRNNEELQHWISEEDGWEFATTFNIPADAAAHSNLDLLFDGLDTLADVKLDGQTILTARNFHRQYRVPLSTQDAGDHNLTITFRSPIRAAYDAAASYPYVVPSNQAPRSYEFYNFVRKPASDYGWDWGPAIAPIGIHGNITLVAYSTPWITGAHVTQSHDPDQGVIRVDVEVAVVWPDPQPSTSPRSDATLSVELPGVEGVTQASEELTPQPPGLHYQRVQLVVPMRSVELWWPRGHGEQPLYELIVSLAPPNVTTCDLPQNGTWPGALQVRRVLHHPAQPCSALSLTLGFRRIELITEPLEDAWHNIHGTTTTTTTTSTSSQPAGHGTHQARVRRVVTRADGPDDAPDTTTTTSPDTTTTAATTTSSARPPRVKRVSKLLSEPTTAPGSSGGIRGSFAAGNQPHFGNTTTTAVDFGISNTTTAVPTPTGFKRVTLPGAPSQAAPGRGQPAAPEGESFYFRVNGVAVYVQGANLIPLDVLHVRGARPEGVRALLRQAVRANMNMIRVWGGGRYQVDSLYEWCDRHGVMVWQEFMYACAPYPLIPDLLQEGVLEAEEVVRHLGHHASIAIWGGNNEVEALFVEQSAVLLNLALYVSDFNVWFTHNIKGVVEQLDPSRPYVDTSPSNGLYSREPYIKRWGNAQDPRYGDVHYYKYDVDCEDTSLIPPAKFVSETGWQSAPGWEAVARQTAQEDWAVAAPGMQYRQRHPEGDSQMIAQMHRHFRLPHTWLTALDAPLRVNGTSAWGVRPGPSGWAAPGDDEGGGGAANASEVELYHNWIYLTQVQQAQCITAGARYWRALAHDPSALNMGLLYWQLNDIWAGYSWSSLDYPSRPGATPHWRPLHYAMARTWAPLALLTATDSGQAQVNVTSSWGVDMTANLTLRLVPTWATPDNCTALPTLATLTLMLPPFTMLPAWSAPVTQLLSSVPGCSPTTCFISIEATYRVLPPTEAQMAARIGNGSAGSEGSLIRQQRAAQEEDEGGDGGGSGGVWWESGLDNMAGVTWVGDGTPSHTPSGDIEGNNGTGGGVWQTHAQLWFAVWKDMPAPLAHSPPLLSDWVQRSQRVVCFTVRSETLLPQLVFEAPGFDGYFSDNLITVDPCLPQRLCFTHDGGEGEGFSVQALQDKIAHVSLADALYG